MADYRWLDRSLALPGPYLTLCLREQEYLHAMQHCKIKHPPPWVKTERANATAHFLVNDNNEATCIVCIRGWEDRDPIEVAGLLVHEAVHIWQEHAASIGESAPGSEQEAYAIQSIAQQLMAEFARRMEA